MPRVILCVLDSFGIGGAPDAADFGDEGANTLLHIATACAEGRGDIESLRSGPLYLPNLDGLGLGCAAHLSCGTLPPGLSDTPLGGRWGVGREVSIGKDTPSGHWEIAGVPVPFAWGYFPQTVPTFPEDLVDKIVAASGVPGILGNRHASGTQIIEAFGDESIATGKPICYTSVDSVFQIAAHEDHFGLERLYELCQTVFEFTAPMKIGRVIARPFVGEAPGAFKRTGNRRDFAIAPPEPTILDRISGEGGQVYAIGKVSDIYAGRGITHKIKAAGNMVLFDRTLEALEMAQDRALIFTNFVDFDTEFGHRRDPAGYAEALEAFDRRLPELIAAMAPDDLVIITADHGNDPTWRGTDHTREQVPILLFSPALSKGTIGLRQVLSDIGETIAHWLGLRPGPHGKSAL
ncbi:phosphopentomutase [Pelagibacterium montanilacus]|uniref:phosphopentomutase n=1 Tax=Pelagibacterium montanilacus TaxID=2185280 RepID=UPI000F8F2A36|nr:phosphopentomutase [Pelagibacterium montanilacus]